MDAIVELVARVDTIHLGIQDTPWPYVVPVSFGFVLEPELTFFFHGAREGKKAQLLARDGHVCIEGAICRKFVPSGTSFTCLYESFIAFGMARLLETDAEKIRGLEQIVDHCGFGLQRIPTEPLPRTNVYAIAIESITGKHREASR